MILLSDTARGSTPPWCLLSHVPNQVFVSRGYVLHWSSEISRRYVSAKTMNSTLQISLQSIWSTEYIPEQITMVPALRLTTLSQRGNPLTFLLPRSFIEGIWIWVRVVYVIGLAFLKSHVGCSMLKDRNGLAAVASHWVDSRHRLDPDQIT